MKIHSFKILYIALVLCILSFKSIAQTTCYETVTLPSDSKFGGGDTQGSVLIGNTYGAGQGPGIYIVADGGYRLYLNGELLAYDNTAGRVRFIPMTFLPLTNAISIYGINGANAPGVMLHIDELHQTIVTDGSWKSKTSAYIADNSWKTKTFDMSGWGNATVQSTGSLIQTPGGLAISGFPTNSPAKWIWSGSTADVSGVLRFAFNIKATGFGAATTGGDGGTVVVVKTAAELNTQMTSTGPKIILVPEGIMDLRESRDQSVCYQTCADKLTNGGYNGNWITNGATCPGTTITVKRHEKLIWVKSNKTIIGMGRGASLRGAAFYSNSGSPQTNFIFRNLKIWDVNPHIVEAGDGISLNSVTKLWVDHCTFKWISDGNDIADTKECTFSWNRWNGYNEYMCTTRDNYSTMITGSDITFDHVWWEGSAGRVPKTYGTSNTRIHMINNYHSDNTYYATNSGSPTCLVYVENTHYDGVRFPTVKEHGGVIYCSGNKYDNIGSHSIDWVNSSEPKDLAAKFTVPYTYSLDPVADIKTMLMGNAGTGGKWGVMPTYTDVAGFSNVAPIVSVSSPVNNATYTNPSSVSIASTVSDTDGNIAKVEYYSGSVKLGENASAPFSFDLTALATCTYSVVAVATDNSGNKTMSWPITFSVNMPTQKATLAKQGAGSSNQTITLGSAIVPYSFAWNYASTVTVTGMPAGIVVDINNATKTVSISGTPTQIGVFKFAVTTVGGSPDSTKSGSITVNNVVTDVNTENLTSQRLVYPNPFTNHFTIQQNRQFDYQLFDNKGTLLLEGKAENEIQIGESLAKGLYILKIKNEGDVTVCKVVKE